MQITAEIGNRRKATVATYILT